MINSLFFLNKLFTPKTELAAFAILGKIVILKQVLLKGLSHMEVYCICNLLISY